MVAVRYMIIMSRYNVIQEPDNRLWSPNRDMLNEIISQNAFTIIMSYALAVRCTQVLIMCIENASLLFVVMLSFLSLVTCTDKQLSDYHTSHFV